MKLSLTLFFLICLFSASAQSKKDSTYQWDNNLYTDEDADRLPIKLNDADISGTRDGLPYYLVKINKYSFKAKYLGKTRRIDTMTVHSMKNIFKNKAKTVKLDRLFSKEILIKIGDREVWMPIEKGVLDDFTEYVKKDDEITLYCLYLNDHALDKNSLNNLLIAEYDKEYFPVVHPPKKKSPIYISSR